MLMFLELESEENQQHKQPNQDVGGELGLILELG